MRKWLISLVVLLLIVQVSPCFAGKIYIDGVQTKDYDVYLKTPTAVTPPVVTPPVVTPPIVTPPIVTPPVVTPPVVTPPQTVGIYSSLIAQAEVLSQRAWAAGQGLAYGYYLSVSTNSGTSFSLPSGSVKYFLIDPKGTAIKEKEEARILGKQFQIHCIDLDQGQGVSIQMIPVDPNGNLYLGERISMFPMGNNQGVWTSSFHKDDKRYLLRVSSIKYVQRFYIMWMPLPF